MNPISGAWFRSRRFHTFETQRRLGKGIEFLDAAKAESGTGGSAKNFLIMELFAVRIRNRMPAGWPPRWMWILLRRILLRMMQMAMAVSSDL
jgi:hypothetical protein